MTRKKRKRRSVCQSIWSVRHHPRTDQFVFQTPPDRRSPSLTRGRYYSRETGCQTRRVGFLEHFLSACLRWPESSRICPVRFFFYENHNALRVEKLSTKECRRGLDRPDEFEWGNHQSTATGLLRTTDFERHRRFIRNGR